MYAKLCDLEILSSYLSDISVGDMLSVQASIRNPLDWHHFYDKISTIKKESKTDFIVVTIEGDRIVGSGEVTDIERWNNYGQYGFKIKIKIKRQKSLTDRRLKSIHSNVQQTTIPKRGVNSELEISPTGQPLTT
jgi:hypothetical protein